MSTSFKTFGNVPLTEIRKRNNKYSVRTNDKGEMYISLSKEYNIDNEECYAFILADDEGNICQFDSYLGSHGYNVVREIAVDFNVQFYTDDLIDDLLYISMANKKENEETEIELQQKDYDYINNHLGLIFKDGKVQYDD